MLLLLLLAGRGLAAQPSGADRRQWISEDLTDSAAIARRSEELAVRAWELKSNHPDSSLQLADRALALARAINHQRGMADALHVLGMGYWYLGNLEMATDYLFQALVIREAIDDELGLGRSYNNIGNVFFEQKNWQEASKYYRKGLQLRQQLKDTFGLVYSYSNMADVYAALDIDSLAHAYYQQALQLAEGKSFGAGRSFVLRRLGSWQMERQRPDSATWYFDRSLAIARRINDRNQEAEALNKLIEVRLHRTEQDWNELIDLALAALNISYEIGALDIQTQSARNLALLHARVGNFSEAYQYQQTYHELSTRMFNVQSNRAILDIETRYDMARKETELLQQRTALLEQEKKVNRLTAVVLLLFLLALTVGGLFIYARLYTQKQLSAKLQATNEAIEAQNRQLRDANAELEQFNYAASHDLKEPLRNVGSFATLLDRRFGEQLPVEARQYLNIITDGVRQMYQLLEDLLAFSRIRQNDADAPQAIDLNETVAKVVRSLGSQIQEKQAIVEIGPLPVVASQGFLMYQLWQNLLSNSLKFTNGVRPRIEVGHEAQDALYHFWVKDNGIGIDPAYHARIFQVFQRLHKHEYDGTGIGLAIVDRIVRIHDGRIWVDSAENIGTTFHFTIPR